MPRDRHAIILKELQDVIKHSDPNITAGRHLAIERWVKAYIRQVEYLEDNKLQFLYNIFRDESCWSGTRLNNTTLGKRLTEESINGIENPLSRYDMACRYCVVDKIYPLFQEQFKSYKDSFEMDKNGKPVGDDGKPVINQYIRNELLDYMESQDPALSFWINKNSGKFQNPSSNKEGFQKAVDLKWSEGVEYFYNCLSKKERESGVISAITTLSTIQCNYNCATVLDFCLQKISNPTRHKLLLQLSEKDQGVYSLLNGLIRCGFFDTVQDIVKRWCYEEASIPADKILSHRNYALLLSSLSDMILENPGLDTQAKAIIRNLWKCDRFNEHKKAAVDLSSDIVSVVYMKGALAGLIVDWKRHCGDGDDTKKGEILEILQFAKDCCSAESFIGFKKHIIKTLRITGRHGMKKDIDYGKLAEELFSELDKVPLLHERGDVRGSGYPQSALGDAGISGLPGRSK